MKYSNFVCVYNKPIGKRCRDVNTMPIEKLNSRFNLHA